MQAVVLNVAGEPLEVLELPTPEAARGERLVHIRACGICGTDVKLRAGKIPGVKLPLVLGHEPAGVEVDSGKRVVVYPHLSCGQCPNCVEGRENICLRTRGTMGITASGALAEYVTVPEQNLVELPKDLDFEHGALAGGVVAVSLCAARKLGSVLDRWVIVAGLGGLGLVAAQVLHAAGARVVGLSRSEEKRKLAMRLGAVAALDTEGSYEEEVRNLTGGVGVTAAMDFTGVSTQVTRLVRCMRRGGQIVLGGNTSGGLTVPYAETVMNGVDMLGSRSYTREDVRVALGLMERGKVDPLIGRTVGLDEVDTALDWIAEGSVTGRVVATVD
jgi:2-desacetyl-2-hydroxyethyl bacteriochlorophyllide A dehydrogenase